MRTQGHRLHAIKPECVLINYLSKYLSSIDLSTFLSSAARASTFDASPFLLKKSSIDTFQSIDSSFFQLSNGVIYNQNGGVIGNLAPEDASVSVVSQAEISNHIQFVVRGAKIGRLENVLGTNSHK